MQWRSSKRVQREVEDEQEEEEEHQGLGKRARRGADDEKEQ